MSGSPDAGLYGPDSVTWRLHADPVYGVAGLRALLLQALHPVAVHGVFEHSTFREDVWGRLANTAEFVGVTTYGSTVEAITMGARVRAIHMRVSGVEPTTGRSYRADDPDLLAWVHNCLVDSALDVLPRAVVPLTDADADRYVAEQVRSAVLVGLDTTDVPHTRAALADYFEQVRPQLRATKAAREAASYVIAPPIPARYAIAARPAWSSLSGLAFAALPVWARRLYSIPDLPGVSALHSTATTVALRTLQASMRGVQYAVPALRESPHRKAARERLTLVPPLDADPDVDPDVDAAEVDAADDAGR